MRSKNVQAGSAKRNIPQYDKMCGRLTRLPDSMPGHYRRSLRALGRCLIVCIALAAGIGAQRADNNAGPKGGPEITKSAPAQDLAPALSAIQKGIEDVSGAIKTVGADSNSEEDQKREAADLRAQEDIRAFFLDISVFIGADRAWIGGKETSA